jgi:hypothetical protein
MPTRPTDDKLARRVLDVCRTHNIKANNLVLLSMLHSAVEASGVPPDEAIKCVARAIAWGWLELGALPGQVRLTELGFASLSDSVAQNQLKRAD